MTQELKDLLNKDLCARLPYGVKISVNGKVETLQGIDMLDNADDPSDVEEVKPYLFPMSSMNEEQANELFNLFGISILDSVGRDYIKINECTGITFFLNKGFDVETHLDKLMNWIYTNHFDFRGLIPMGFAIDTTGLNIY